MEWYETQETHNDAPVAQDAEFLRGLDTSSENYPSVFPPQGGHNGQQMGGAQQMGGSMHHHQQQQQQQQYAMQQQQQQWFMQQQQQQKDQKDQQQIQQPAFQQQRGYGGTDAPQSAQGMGYGNGGFPGGDQFGAGRQGGMIGGLMMRGVPGMGHPGLAGAGGQGQMGGMMGQPGGGGAAGEGGMMSGGAAGGYLPDRAGGYPGGMAALPGGGGMAMHANARSVPASAAQAPGGGQMVVKRQSIDLGDSFDGGEDSSKGGKKASKRSLTATIERMEKHKIVERKRREKTKELMTELQALIPSVENVQDSLTMNTVLEEAIVHLKDQHTKSSELVVAKPRDGDSMADPSPLSHLSLAHAFGRDASSLSDGFSLMSPEVKDEGGSAVFLYPRGEPTSGVRALEVTTAKAAATLNLGRLPDQEFMQETLYAKMLEGWEKKVGEELVRQALSLLCLSREGLSQQELEELMHIKERGLEDKWQELARDLNADLAMKSEGLLGFVYSAFRLAVERRYLKAPSERRDAEAKLAAYWEKKSGGPEDDNKRMADELPYVLERMGEWDRLRTCLSSSLDVLYQLYNDTGTADLLRFWRKGSEQDDVSGYAAAAQAYIARLKRFESDGATPQLLWESSLMTARFLGDAGQFSEAEKILARARELSKELGGNDRFVAEVSLRCAELLNKCAASTPEYPLEIMVQSAFYAKEAADLYAYMTDNEAKQGYATALYWMGLNFGTVCRIGGGGTWSAKRAHDIAEQAIGKCLAVRQELGCDQSKITEVLFGRGVIAFCKAEAMSLEAISPSGDKTAEQEILELQETALALFHESYQQLCQIYSDKHLEAIKCLTMLGLLSKRLGRLQEAVGWYMKEVTVRDEVQGQMHPRSQQARRVYTELLDNIAEAKGMTGGEEQMLLLNVPVKQEPDGEGQVHGVNGPEEADPASAGASAL